MPYFPHRSDAAQRDVQKPRKSRSDASVNFDITLRVTKWRPLESNLGEHELARKDRPVLRLALRAGHFVSLRTPSGVRPPATTISSAASSSSADASSSSAVASSSSAVAPSLSAAACAAVAPHLDSQEVIPSLAYSTEPLRISDSQEVSPDDGVWVYLAPTKSWHLGKVVGHMDGEVLLEFEHETDGRPAGDVLNFTLEGHHYKKDEGEGHPPDYHPEVDVEGHDKKSNRKRKATQSTGQRMTRASPSSKQRGANASTRNAGALPDAVSDAADVTTLWIQDLTADDVQKLTAAQLSEAITHRAGAVLDVAANGTCWLYSILGNRPN